MNKLDKTYTDLLQEIKTVEKALQSKFPHKPYTIRILLWNDNTRSVQCKYGDNNKNYTFTFKDGVMTYDEEETDEKVMILNKSGEEEFYKLVKE